MDTKANITADYLRSILDYESSTGVFTWRRRPPEHFKTRRACSIFNARDAGCVAGSKMSDGYWKITIDDEHYLAHRLAWLWVTGAWPADEIDHRDWDRANNRFENLRAASRSQNCAHVRLRADNSSRFKGVHYCRRDKKWIARIQNGKKRRIIGYYSDPIDAHRAYAEASESSFGEFSCAASVLPPAAPPD